MELAGLSTLPIFPKNPLVLCQSVLYVFQSLLNNAKECFELSTEL